MKNQFIISCISQSTIKEEDKEIIIYGLKIIGTSIFTSFVIILFGIIMRQPLSVIIYLSVLILIRRNMGGYHSKTFLGCLLITSMNLIIIVLLEKKLSHDLKEILGVAFIIYSSIKIYTSKLKVHRNRTINKTAIPKSSAKKDNWLIIILAFTTILHFLTLKGLTNDINYFFVTRAL